MTTKHTPGPWVTFANLSASENHKGFKLVDSDGYWLADISPRDEDGSEGGANAKLMAHATDLLDALQICESVLRIKGYVNAAEIAQAAIAKATGEL
jgi:hypothetical protein